MLDDINIKYWELSTNPKELGLKKADCYAKKCDICGDSKINHNKKRLCLYTKTSYDDDSIKCFNCGYTATMHSYLKNYHPELFDSYKKEKSNKSINTLVNHSPLIINQDLKRDDLIYFDLKNQLIPLSDSEEGSTYIKSRGLSPNGMYFCNKNITIANKTINLQNYIIIPLLKNGNWYGFYSRSIEKKIFHTFLPEHNSGFKIWNYFNVTKFKTVYIFESIFNALSSGLTNSIAMLGADIPEDKYSVFQDVVFVYDNDETGRDRSLDKIKKGMKVFIWDNTYNVKDINDLKSKVNLTEYQIAEYIKSNIFSGIMAEVSIKLRRR